MQLNKDLPLAERQRLAAVRTNEVRQKTTESKVRAACRHLQKKGEVLTQAAIANLASLSRQTVAAYKYVLNEVLSPAARSVLRKPVTAKVGVNYDVHQVSVVTSEPLELVVKWQIYGFIDSS